MTEEKNKWRRAEDLVEKNKRDLTEGDAQTAYYDFVEKGEYPEDIVYNLIKLCEELQFSACEMWPATYRSYLFRNITHEDIEELRNLTQNLKLAKLAYYSKEMADTLYKTLNFCKDKIREYGNPEYGGDKLGFYQHFYQSCTKEFYCYRAYRSKERPWDFELKE